MNNFKEKYGDKLGTIVCFGDFEQKKHMKFKEPTKGKGMRKLFRQNGYEVFLVDEFRTSKMCSRCMEGECEKFMKRKNPRPYRDEMILVHGLLRCKNECGYEHQPSYWNRDCNASINIYRIAKSAVEGKERPEYLKRSHQND